MVRRVLQCTTVSVLLLLLAAPSTRAYRRNYQSGYQVAPGYSQPSYASLYHDYYKSYGAYRGYSSGYGPSSGANSGSAYYNTAYPGYYYGSQGYSGASYSSSGYPSGYYSGMSGPTVGNAGPLDSYHDGVFYGQPGLAGFWLVCHNCGRG